MKSIIGIVIVSIVIIAAVVIGVSYAQVGYNKTVGTELEKSRQDKSREAFKQGKPYVDNMASTLASYKMQYDLAKDEDKLIIKNNIKMEFSNFDTDLIENYNLRMFLYKMMEE